MDMRIFSSARASRAQTIGGEQIATDRLSDLLLLIAVQIVVVLLRLPGLPMPLERDEGAYAYVAWTWLHGGLPYRDAFDHKPPLIYLLYMPALLWGPPSALAIRVWATVLTLVSVGVVYAIGRRVWDRATAVLVALLFGVAGSAFDLQGMILNTDQALVLPALIGLWCAIRLGETQQMRWTIATGVALAVAALIKPVAIVLLPAVLLASGRDLRSLARVVGGVALGGAIVALPIGLYFWARGAWNDLIFGLLTYNRVYAAESQDRWELGGLVDMFAPFVPLLLVAVGSLPLIGQVDPQQRRSRWLIAAWGAGLLLAALGSLRAYVHYYYPVLPLLALLAAPSIRWLWKRDPQNAIGNRLAAPLLLALLIVPLGSQNLSLVGTTAEQQAERLYGDSGKHFFAQAPLVAQFVRDHTAPGDPIYIFAAEPQVYLLSERRTSSRYIYDYPLALLPSARAELARDLQQKPPALVITYYGVRPDAFFPTINAQSFEKIAEIGGFEVFGPPQR
jgi:4-amino-4-deoxy-L-arabinose transferase-like glycosyltransferase